MRIRRRMQRASLHLINNAERATHKHRKFENRKERKNDCVQVEWRKSGDDLLHNDMANDARGRMERSKMSECVKVCCHHQKEEEEY